MNGIERQKRKRKPSEPRSNKQIEEGRCDADSGEVGL